MENQTVKETQAVQTAQTQAPKNPFALAVKGAKPTFKQVYGEESESLFLKEYGFAIMQSKTNPQLQKCDPESVRNAIIQVALTGLTLNPVKQSAYLVPRGNTCTLDIGYQGMIDILIKSGSIISMYGDVILNGEEYEYQQGTSPVLLHKNDLSIEMKEENCIAAYCIATLADGTKQPFVMRASEIMAHKNVSKSKGSTYSPWNTDFWKSMYIKTVIRYSYKFLPKSESVDKMIRMINEANPVDFRQKPVNEITYE